MKNTDQFGKRQKGGYNLGMHNDRTNRLAMILVVFCCIGTTAMHVPTSTQTVLSVVVGGNSMQIAYEFDPLEFQIGNSNSVVIAVAHIDVIVVGVNMELQNLPPPLV